MNASSRSSQHDMTHTTSVQLHRFCIQMKLDGQECIPSVLDVDRQPTSPGKASQRHTCEDHPVRRQASEMHTVRKGHDEAHAQDLCEILNFC
jgi:hypothetical protein